MASRILLSNFLQVYSFREIDVSKDLEGEETFFFHPGTLKKQDTATQKKIITICEEILGSLSTASTQRSQTTMPSSPPAHIDLLDIQRKLKELIEHESIFEKQCHMLQERYFLETNSPLATNFKDNLYKLYYLTNRLGRIDLFHKIIDFSHSSLSLFQNYFHSNILNDLGFRLAKLEEKTIPAYLESYLYNLYSFLEKANINAVITYCFKYSFWDLMRLVKQDPFKTITFLEKFKDIDLIDIQSKPFIQSILRIQAKLPLEETELGQNLFCLDSLQSWESQELLVQTQRLLNFCEHYIEKEPTSTIYFLVRLATFVGNNHQDLVTTILNFSEVDLPSIFSIVNEIRELKELKNLKAHILLQLEIKLHQTPGNLSFRRNLIAKIKEKIAVFVTNQQALVLEWIISYLSNNSSPQNLLKELLQHLENASLMELRFVEMALITLDKESKNSYFLLALRLAIILPYQLDRSLLSMRHFDESTFEQLITLAKTEPKRVILLLQQTDIDWESIPLKDKLENKWETQIFYDNQDWKRLSHLITLAPDLEKLLIFMPITTIATEYSSILKAKTADCASILRFTYSSATAIQILFDDLDRQGPLSSQFLAAIKVASPKALINLTFFLEYKESTLFSLLLELILQPPPNITQDLIEQLIDKGRLLEPQILQQAIQTLKCEEEAELKIELIELLSMPISAKRIAYLFSSFPTPQPPQPPLNRPLVAPSERMQLDLTTLSVIPPGAYFETQLTIKLADFILSPEGEFEYSRIRVAKAALMSIEMNEAQQQRMLYTLHCLETNNFFDLCLRRVRVPQDSSPLCILIAKMLKKESDTPITDRETQLIVLSALLMPTRQAGIGSCFATSLMIQEESYELGLLQKLHDLCFLIENSTIERVEPNFEEEFEKITSVPVFVGELLEEPELEDDHLLNRALEFTLATFEPFGCDLEETTQNRLSSISSYFSHIFRHNLSKQVSICDAIQLQSLFKNHLLELLQKRCQLAYMACKKDLPPSTELGAWVLFDPITRQTIDNCKIFRPLIKEILNQLKDSYLETLDPKYNRWAPYIATALNKIALFVESPLLEQSQSSWNRFRKSTSLFIWYEGGFDPAVRKLFFSSNLPMITSNYCPLNPKHNFLMIMHIIDQLPNEMKVLIRENLNMKIPFAFPQHACSLSPEPILFRLDQGESPIQILDNYVTACKNWLEQRLSREIIDEIKKLLLTNCFNPPPKEIAFLLKDLESIEFTNIQSIANHFFISLIKRGIALSLIDYYIDLLMIFFWKQPALEARVVCLQVGDTNWRDKEVLAFMPHPLLGMKEVAISWDFTDIEILDMSGPSKVCSFAPFPSLTQE